MVVSSALGNHHTYVWTGQRLGVGGSGTPVVSDHSGHGGVRWLHALGRHGAVHVINERLLGSPPTPYPMLGL